MRVIRERVRPDTAIRVLDDCRFRIEDNTTDKTLTEFAKSILDEIHKEGHTVVAIYTRQPIELRHTILDIVGPSQVWFVIQEKSNAYA